MPMIQETMLKRLILPRIMARGEGGTVVEDSATGNPVTFETDLARKLKSLVANFLPVQASGTPSPENELPITGWTGVNVGHAEGKNLLPDNAVEYGSYGTDGGKIQEESNKYRRLSIDLPAGNYVFSTDTENCYIIRLLVNNSVVGTGGAIQSKAFTLTESANVKIAWRNTDTSAITATLHNQIELGNSATAYEPYKYCAYYPVTWSDHGTIYGGYVALVTGEVWGTWNGINLGSKTYTKRSENQSRQIWEATFNDAKFIGTSPWSAEAKCSQFDLTTSNGAWTVGKFAPAFSGTNQVFIFAFPPNSFASGTECKEAMDGVQLVYKLKSPVLITTLTPQQINAIKGNNTIWSDANDNIEVTYYKKES